MSNDEPLTLDCRIHGRGIAAVVCGHMLGATDLVLGFVENSDDPDDLQAWCDDCEAMFLREEDKTDAFREFNGMTLVCTSCYAALKQRHSKLEE